MEDEVAAGLVLDAAEELFYGRGIQAVGMDAVRTRSGISLKRLYRLFASKDELVEAYLTRRDERWRARLQAHVSAVAEPGERVLAVFDWLAIWFAEPDFRGCAFINSYGELGPTSARIAEISRSHKRRFREYVESLAAEAGLAAELAAQLVLLAEGAMVVAGMEPGPAPARDARRAAEALLR
ncbi:TetR/AcrR family transcriptional regulator [Amycolatopsis sp. 195334CR]|uniref:TetR/AcrR family transcriptional regulator n=1 Tax=Amycolatopsis sp. 195334CR TaxID=2814588 RepID=UPI001A8FE8AF|nr:TetR/AcrR family transcriptional regulator [Amycolatopsis sp. 195334CR]MBN6039211.1 helix-turn-helix transcriptional regulator [Amycolatopsis sp. 195334CR]